MTAATITGAGGAHVPLVFLLYASTRSARSLDHEIVGSPDLAVTLRPAGLRRGRFAGMFDDLAAAYALEADLAADQTLTLADTDRPDFDMTFYVPRGGTIEVEIDTRTRNHWVVTWDFQEVTP